MNLSGLKKIIILVTGLTLLSTGNLSRASYKDYSSRLLNIIPPKARHSDKLGVIVKSIITDQKIFEFNADKMFIPASNQKVITSTTALALLKSDYIFKTDFYSGGEITGGIMHGGLYIKGRGDPMLSTEQLDVIAYKFKKMGISEIKGDIFLDDSYFDNINYPLGWKKQWKNDIYSPPIGTFTLNYNNVEVVASPSKSRKSVYVRTDPEGSGINIINSAKISRKTNSLRAYWSQDDKHIVVSGYLPSRVGEQRLKLPIRNTNRYFGSVFINKLKEQGVRVDGTLKMAMVPRWANLVYTHESEHLDSIIREYNKNSVNVIGENLIKTLGAEFYDEPGSWEKGRKTISVFLSKIGIKNGYKIIDGSGLSLLNRISPHTMTEVLEYAFQNKDVGLDFITSLPVGGVDGTLKRRFRESDLKGRIVAKTGYLNHVRALSGYVFTQKGDVLVFSILSNGLGYEVKKFQSDLMEELVDCCENL